MKENVTNAFDKLSTYYEHEDIRYSTYNMYYERPTMVNLFPKNLEGLKVLDAGCAAGWYTDYLLSKGAAPTALDISPEMVEATKRRTKGNAEVLCVDLSKELPFESDTFDLIVSSLTLHYLEDWHKTFEEFSRVLTRDGVFIFSVHHPIMDISIQGANCYNDTELLVDHWKRNDELIEVQFYRRPLQDIINTTNQYFSLVELVEPIPTEQFRELNPTSYQTLMKRPNFLMIKAINSKT